MISITINAAKKIEKEGVICQYIYIYKLVGTKKSLRIETNGLQLHCKKQDNFKFQCLLPEERKIQQK